MDAAVIEQAGVCPLMTRARALSGRVGAGRPVTATGYLRRPDVAAACAAVGLPDPGRVRSAAADPGLHHAWVAAEGAGLIVVGGDRAVAGPPPGDPVTQWLAGLIALGTDGDIVALRIELTGFRPPVWRRVLMPAGASLGDLHRVIQVVLEWEGDHLRAFTVDRVHFSDPSYDLPECADEDEATLASTLRRPRSSLRYRYDLGGCWDHTVTLEKVVAAEPGRRYPACTGGRGAAPVEDDDPRDPAASPLFRVEDVDARLAGLDHHPGPDRPLLVPLE